MCARHRQHPAAAQDVFRQPLRPRDIRQAAIENFLHQRIAAGNDVADDINVRGEIDLRGVETFDQAYALRLELRAHRRIDIGVATGDGMAGGFGDCRDAAHESTAYAEDMYVH